MHNGILFYRHTSTHACTCSIVHHDHNNGMLRIVGKQECACKVRSTYNLTFIHIREHALETKSACHVFLSDLDAYMQLLPGLIPEIVTVFITH